MSAIARLAQMIQDCPRVHQNIAPWLGHGDMGALSAMTKWEDTTIVAFAVVHSCFYDIAATPGGRVVYHGGPGRGLTPKNNGLTDKWTVKFGYTVKNLCNELNAEAIDDCHLLTADLMTGMRPHEALKSASVRLATRLSRLRATDIDVGSLMAASNTTVDLARMARLLVDVPSTTTRPEAVKQYEIAFNALANDPLDMSLVANQQVLSERLRLQQENETRELERHALQMKMRLKAERDAVELEELEGILEIQVAHSHEQFGVW